MLMALLGFIAPFIPDLIGMGKQQLDHAHEMAMLKLRGDQARDEALWRLNEVEVQADIQNLRDARKPHKSYGIQLLDKADETDGVIWRWSMNIVFLMFGALDWLISFVRPGITYWAFGLYTASKIASVYLIYQASAKFSDGTLEALSRMATNEAFYTPFDQDMLLMIIGFWFGQRIRNGRASSNAQS